jgi:hypothetical protein
LMIAVCGNSAVVGGFAVDYYRCNSSERDFVAYRGP